LVDLEKRQKIASRQVNIVETSLNDCKVKEYTKDELTKDLVEPI
jgi:hypothetical protein